MHTAKVEKGSVVAIFGMGGVGLGAIQGAVMAGAERIVAIDVNPDKEEFARSLGATDFVNPKDHDASIQEWLWNSRTAEWIIPLNVWAMLN